MQAGIVIARACTLYTMNRLVTALALILCVSGCGDDDILPTDSGSDDTSSDASNDTSSDVAPDAEQDAGVEPIGPAGIPRGDGAVWYGCAPAPHVTNAALAANADFQPWIENPTTTPRPAGVTHVINPSADNCSDTGDGTEATPRCTIPAPIPAGSRVMLSGFFDGAFELRAAGTAAEPVFVFGDARFSGADGQYALTVLESSHLYIEDLTFDGSTLVGTETPHGNGAFAVSGSHHITFRRLTIRSYPEPPPRADDPTRSRFFANTSINDANHIVIADCTFEDLGFYPPTYETGKHAIGGGRNANFVWIVGNRFTEGPEDAIHLLSWRGVRSYYWIIAGNHIERMGENGVDIKTGVHNLVCANTMTEFRPVDFGSSGSDGAAVVFNNNDDPDGRAENEGPEESWMVNNHVYDTGLGFRMQSSHRTNYVVGNIIAGSELMCVEINGGSAAVIENNTIYGCGDEGIRMYNSNQETGSVRGNIVVNAELEQIRMNHSYMEGWAVDNLIFRENAEARGRRVDPTTNQIGVDPRLIAPSFEGNGNFSLAEGSPAIDQISGSTVSETFQAQFGIPLNLDMRLQARTQGNAMDLGAVESR